MGLGLDLAHTGFDYNKVIDTLGAGLAVDLETVRLAYGTMSADGKTYQEMEEVPLTLGGTPGYTYVGGETASALTVTLPSEHPERVYQLTYTADITADLGKGNNTFSNEVKLNGVGGSQVDRETAISVSDASAGGSGNRMTLISLIKTDGAGAPLAGAEFAIFDRDGTQQQAHTTEANGKITFKVKPL